MTAARPKLRGVGLMLFCAVLWSLAGLFIKLVPWHPAVLAGWRAFAAAVTLFIFMRFSGFRPRLTRRAAVIGAFVCLTSFGFIAANKLTTSANAIVLQDTSPIFLLALSALFLKKRFRTTDYAATALTVAAIALFFFDELSPGNMLGNAFAIFDGLAFGCVYLLTGESDMQSRLSGVFWGNVFTAAIGIPLTAVFGIELSAASAGFAAILGVFTLAAPYILYSHALSVCRPLECALTGAFEIPLNPLWVWLFIGEAPGAWAAAGSALLFITVSIYTCYNALRPYIGGRVSRDRIGSGGNAEKGRGSVSSEIPN